jgi:hypothetical protein
VALMEGRESVNGGRYDWAEAFGKGHYEKLGGEDCNFSVGYFLVLEFGFGVWVNCCRGHQVAGSFGLGGQESSWNPGAREPDRLLLAGWVVSRFWAGFGQSIKQSLGKVAERTIRGREFSIRQRYFYVCILMNM